MNKIDLDYQELLKDILKNGTKKEDRTGTGTISVFGRTIRHDMKTGFPLLTTKRIKFGLIVTELLWFLRGDTNIKFLVDNNCHIWDGDAYKNYEKYAMSNSYGVDVLSMDEFIHEIKTNDEFAKKWGELGPIYGKQWRQVDKKNGNPYKYEPIDQIANLINDLKTNPDSRRLMVSAWNVGELDQMVLPPCHYGFQVYTRELSVKERLSYFEEFFDCTSNSENMNEHEIHIELSKSNIPARAISLMWNQRSVDTFLGLPFNIASYGLLLEIIAKSVNMVPDELIGNLGDVHLYSNHIEQAKEQIGRDLTDEERIDWMRNNKRKIELPVRDPNVEFSMDEFFRPYGVPKRTREPYPLPTLKINSGNENWHLLNIEDIVNSLDVDLTFKIENYQSHPSIKAPLSN